ncbi:hypothetical protein [Actinomadura terrae]|nr:hypothetical protein [Actinomadura terrae]
MMRIAIAALAGILLAGGASIGAVQLAGASQKDSVVQPAYDYGSR